jgi:hypothetical protein
MNISPEEAGATLEDIQRIVARTRRAIVGAHVADHLIVWGIAWVLGFGATHFTNWHPGWTWLPICAVGAALSAGIGIRAGRRVESPVGGQIFCFLLVLVAFAVVWAMILHPFNHRHLGAYIATVFMFAYVAGGIWFGRFFIGLGLGVTAIALAGVWLAPAWLDLFMSVGGGGAMVASGAYIRRVWK